MSDRKLFGKIKKKDKEAFIEAYDLYVDDIYRFVYFKVGNTEEARDISSNVFLKAWQYILKENVDREKSLRALIYRIARNIIIDYYRQASRREISVDIEAVEISDEGQDLAKALDIDSDLKIVKKALLKLKDEYREIIIMKYINEMSFAEIASITGKSGGNVRVLGYRALKALRDILEK